MKMDKFVIRKRCLDSEDNTTSKRTKTETECDELTEPSPKDTHTKTDSCGNCVTGIFVVKSPVWKEIRAENLDCDYCVLFDRWQANEIFKECEQLLTYNEGKLAKVNIFGKWHDIPRKQVAHGDTGLSYTFSNNTVPARPWTPFLEKIRDTITHVTGYDFNFLLINRYKDGLDHMGEHRDDEKDLVHGYPIASLSLGQPRDFIFKHAEARGKHAKRKIDTVKVELQHGSLLMMKHPTNTHWYHSLPQRKKLTQARINMTFRKMVVK
ncbi:DNA oxidative demethylase ALKBH2-like [Mercenaria mercenaria]|uniref:DNA oxidative demethylase ALKBH2-like n=1 Tax=Mercenaria mercenaria TaxID=6596 RepID=UPI00234FAC71|nr:DNA oxidative demethylase ALKBH2-like [Mercenaria mercenaria]